KHTNWLLIKHRDESARPGEGDAERAEDRSVASGRSMEQIAAGKGRGPKPFMLATRATAKADAVWQSNRSESQNAAADAPSRELSDAAPSPTRSRPKSGAGRA